MTQEEFDSIDWISYRPKVVYNGIVYDLAGIDYREYLIGIREESEFDDGSISYKRCENIELAEQETVRYETEYIKILNGIPAQKIVIENL